MFGWLKRLNEFVERIDVRRLENHEPHHYCVDIILKPGGCGFSNSDLAFYYADRTLIPRGVISADHSQYDSTRLSCYTKDMVIMSFTITHNGKTQTYTVPWENLS